MTSQEEATADAIRYAVLHRLAPGIRHSLMGELQAIQFLAELAARQLQASADPAKVQDGLSHIIAQTRNTVGSCRSIVEWLRPDTGATTALGEGIAQCLKLAGDDWPLRGVEATTKLEATDALVDKAALRELLTASLIALTDMHPGTLDIGNGRIVTVGANESVSGIDFVLKDVSDRGVETVNAALRIPARADLHAVAARR